VYVTDLLSDNPPALLQVVLGKYGYNSAQATDVNPSPSGENPTISSPYIGSGIIIIDSTVYGQSQGGDYTMVIKKTAEGAEGYRAEVRCTQPPAFIVPHGNVYNYYNPPLTRTVNQ
jgi:hypothetical protein